MFQDQRWNLVSINILVNSEYKNSYINGHGYLYTQTQCKLTLSFWLTHYTIDEIINLLNDIQLYYQVNEIIQDLLVQYPYTYAMHTSHEIHDKIATIVGATVDLKSN